MRKVRMAVFMSILIFFLLGMVWAEGKQESTGAEAEQGFPEEVQIGVLLPLSGKLAVDGENMKAGYDLGAYIINNKLDIDMPLARTEGLPNLGGAKVKLVYGDDQAAPEKGMSETERLITSGNVAAITGSYSSAVTATAQMVAERFQFPFLNALSSSPMLNKKGLEWFFRTTPDDEIFMRSFFDFLKDLEDRDEVSWDTVAIIHEDSLWGTDCGNLLSEFAKDYGYDIVEKISFPSGTVDLTSEVQKLKAADPDILLEFCYAQDQILLVNTMKLLDFNVEMLLSGIQYPSIFESLGEDAEGMIFREVFNEDSVKTNENAAKVVKLWEERVGGGFGNAPRAVNGIIVLADAINRAGSTDPEAIRKALSETDLSSDQLFLPWDGVKFNENGLNIKSNGILVQYLDGELHQVWPFESSAVDVQYPLESWNER